MLTIEGESALVIVQRGAAASGEREAGEGEGDGGSR